MIIQTPEAKAKSIRKWEAMQARSRLRYAQKLNSKPRKAIRLHGVSELSKLVLSADIWFRRFIRLRDPVCVTPSWDCFGRLEASHLFSVSTGSALRFDPRAVFGQCQKHNQRHDSNQEPLKSYFESKYGFELHDQLQAVHRQIYRYTASELRIIISTYKAKVIALEKQQFRD